MKITIAGTGYVGSSSAVRLTQHNEALVSDLAKAKQHALLKASGYAVSVSVE